VLGNQWPRVSKHAISFRIDTKKKHDSNLWLQSRRVRARLIQVTGGLMILSSIGTITDRQFLTGPQTAWEIEQSLSFAEILFALLSFTPDAQGGGLLGGFGRTMA
jgi:hypothetical protein